jgi:hypothetical protein
MSEWHPNWISDPAQVSALLAKWRGATAQGWAYSVSHSQLLIRVHWERKPVDVFSLFLYFKNCSRVSFDDTWPNFDLKVTEMAGKFGREVEATDADRLFVHCCAGPFAYETEAFLKLPGI